MSEVVSNPPRALMRKDHYFVAPIELSTALRAAQFKFDEVLKRASDEASVKALSLHLEAIKELDYLTQLPEVTKFVKEMKETE